MSNTNFGLPEEGSYEMFDRLPSIVRRALANSDYDWAVEPFLHEYRGGRSIAGLIADIRNNDKCSHRRVARTEGRTVFDSRGRAIS